MEDIREKHKFVKEQTSVIDNMVDQINQLIKHKSVLEI